MDLFKRKPKIISVVNKDTLHFIELTPEKKYRILESVWLDLFLGNEISLNGAEDKTRISNKIRERDNELLIVPNYWLSNTSYQFQSNKESLIEAFIERKLFTEHPDVPELSQFFEYNPYQSAEEGKKLHVNYYQDPSFFSLYNKISEQGLCPRRITTGLFLCEHEVKKKVSDFHMGGKGIIHLSEQGCYLYFFSRGNFLFERDIILPDIETAQEERAGTLTYEINQSLHLFSQKSKAELNEFYFMSSCEENMSDITESIGVKVNDLSELMIEKDRIDKELSQAIGSLALFRSTDIHTSNQLTNIPHRKEKKEMEWKPVQRTGIALGIILLLFICLESGYVWHQVNSMRDRIKSGRMMTSHELDEMVGQYNEALDLLLEESQRKSPVHIIAGIINSLPEYYQPKEIFVDVEQNRSLNFLGTVPVNDIGNFRESLSDFVSSMNKHLPLKKKMHISDIEFKRDQTIKEMNDKYNIQMKAEFN